jgi:ATP-dependent phosphoenolpyruvate carboxykinase
MLRWGSNLQLLWLDARQVRTAIVLTWFGCPAGAFPANRFSNYMTSTTSVDISLKHKEMVILGTQYAGEMKKGVFR